MTNEQTQSAHLPAETVSQQARSSTSGQIPQAWIGRLFDRLSGFYGAKFADLWRGCDMSTVKDTWADALAGYSADEIRLGLELCRTRIFPPTLPEFLMLCRPPIDPESAYIEACKQMSARDNGADVWSNPAIFWAARAFGVHELRGSTWQTAKTRWTRILDEYLAKPSHDPVPQRMACLPEPGKGTADPAKVKAAMDLLRKALSAKSASFTDAP